MAAMQSTQRVSDEVSFDDESLILVDERDQVLGYRSKAECHDGEGILHRAFSLFVFNDAGELLLQQRSARKRLWPLFWSNSCCSHPRAGESMDVAVQRRLGQELDISAELQYLYKFRYHARYADAGSEHELCWVYIGVSREQVRENTNEIAAWRFVAPTALDQEMADRPGSFTPWFQQEWARIRQNHAAELAALPRGKP